MGIYHLFIVHYIGSYGSKPPPMSRMVVLSNIMRVILGPKAIMNGITIVHERKILAAFLEKCPEQYTM